MKEKFKNAQEQFKTAFFDECNKYFNENLAVRFGYIDYAIKDKAGYFVPYTVDSSLEKMAGDAFFYMPSDKLVEMIHIIKQNIGNIYNLERDYIKNMQGGRIREIVSEAKMAINQASFRDGGSFVCPFEKKGEEIARTFVTLKEISLAQIVFANKQFKEEIIPFIFFDAKIKTIFTVN